MSENNFKNISDFTSVYSEQIKKLAEITRPIFDNINKTILPLQEAAKSIRESMVLSTKSIQPLIDINKKIAVSMQPLIDSLTKSKNDSNSKLSWYEYYKALSKCYWVFPYGISTDELKTLTEKEISEAQFDKYMVKHFKKKVLLDLKKDTLLILPRKSKRIFTQSMDALLNKSYALANLGFISIIDNLSSFYLMDKKCNGRNGLFEPIVQDIGKLDLNDIETKHFILLMMNENINTLYKDYPFDEPIKINNNKDINRQTSMHGKYYSNKKASSLMLVNTIYYLAYLNRNFSNYKNKIKRKTIKEEGKQKRIFLLNSNCK